MQARMPAWTKGKSVTLDLSKTHIKLALREENAPVIEVTSIHALSVTPCILVGATSLQVGYAKKSEQVANASRAKSEETIVLHSS